MKNEEEGSIRKGREDDENNKTGGAVVVKARVAPSGAFGLPMSFDLVCRSIVFLDDALCAFPIGHGVLLVESERGRQVAFVPGTPGQRKVTAIAAKKCFGGGSARERSEDFLEQEEEERKKRKKRMRMRRKKRRMWRKMKRKRRMEEERQIFFDFHSKFDGFTMCF